MTIANCQTLTNFETKKFVIYIKLKTYVGQKLRDENFSRSSGDKEVSQSCTFMFPSKEVGAAVPV